MLRIPQPPILNEKTRQKNSYKVMELTRPPILHKNSMQNIYLEYTGGLDLLLDNVSNFTAANSQ